MVTTAKPNIKNIKNAYVDFENKISCCGRDCTKCTHFPHDCTGCNTQHGRVFWLEFVDEVICSIYNCCLNGKNLPDCGLCDKHPCYRYDESQGTDGMSGEFSGNELVVVTPCQIEIVDTVPFENSKGA